MPQPTELSPSGLPGPGAGVRSQPATNTILNAIAASTGADGTCTYPSVASASVMLWATVNAVTVLTNSHVPRVMMSKRQHEQQMIDAK